LDNVKRNSRAFCESLIRFIQYQIMIATIERLSRISPGAAFLVDALHPTNFLQPTMHQSTQSPVRCEAASMRPRGRRPAGSGGSGRGACIMGARPAGTRRCRRAVPYGIHQGQTWRPGRRFIASGLRQSD
jgi:hypothetical protein